ncbi:light-regulated signal transduction histidine kinase (bacteriophytochrome) [Priestia megaterium]
MALFKADTLKKVNSTKEKFNKKKTELQEKCTKLVEEKDMLRSALENDLQRQIMEGTSPDKKLQNEFDKVNADIERVNVQLESLEGILSKELQKHKGDIKKESDKVASTYSEQESKLEEDLKQIKLQYFEKLVEYHEVYLNASRKYSEFHNIMDTLEIPKRPINKNIAFNMVQDLNNQYQGMFSTAELRDAYYGKVPYSAKQYKNSK